jgi:hypothetical protein
VLCSTILVLLFYPIIFGLLNRWLNDARNFVMVFRWIYLTRWVTHTHMGMGANPYSPVYIGDPMRLFLCRGYEYGVIIPVSIP